MEASKKEKALQKAYECVCQLSYSQKMLSEMYGINPKTLRRIRDAKRVKLQTHEYAMSVFVGIINRAYMQSLSEDGGSSAMRYLLMLKDVMVMLYA